MRFYHTNGCVFAGLLAVIATLATASTARGAEIRLGNVIPGAGVIHKEVISQREARYLNLVPQNTDFSCGAAAVATILKYGYGHENVTEESVMAGLLEVSDPELVREKGFSLLDIRNYVESIGMRGVGYEIEAEILEQVKVPVIVLLDIKGYKHFVVFQKAEAGRIYIADPALGNKIMDEDDFIAGWNGIIFAVIGPGFDRETVLLQPRPPLTARRLMTTFAPATTSELLDFGFTHAELF